MSEPSPDAARGLGPLAFVWRMVPHGSVVLVFAAIVAASLTEGLGIVMLVPLLAIMADGPAPGGIVAHISDAIAAVGIPLRIGPLLLAFVALVALRAALKYAQGMQAARLELTLVDGLRDRIYRALLNADLRFAASLRLADNSSLILDHVNMLGFGFRSLVQTVSALVAFGALGLAALLLSPLLALGIGGGGLLVLAFYARLRCRARMMGKELNLAHQAVHARLGEGLGALRLIKSFGQEEASAHALTHGFRSVRETQIAFQRMAGLGQAMLHIGAASVLALVAGIALSRGVEAAVLIPLVALFARAVPLLDTLQTSWANWSHAIPAAQEAQQLIARADATAEPDDGTVVARPAHTIAVRGVTVRHDGRDAAALHDADLAVRSDETVALVGASGAGKTTLADMLGGLTRPDAGALLLDGQPVGHAERRAWRRHVAYVHQEAVLFNASVRDNLRWAEPDADDAHLERALRMAAAEFVLDLPMGMDTPVGDAGRQLSGGERQRIALARALLRNPALLILDEATSALDTGSEAAIARAIRQVRGSRAIVIIGHRGSLIKNVDRIVELSEGRIVDIRSGREDAA
ncbi:ABC transporter ATP-binding protein [Croceicoccus sp. YJ47]|uniref:ABC transporter ATP-binding protein n=1 Tax=Croceicoccus sp. YJ47 TaxID=2798724 RepID=UPI001922A4A3|nr:ABC transporter ATP-binding protein [Croceicoccus sp. YJ47]QQN72903.1 ABC transporter ATP-binding protein [Croceicoccus sp. YJ47]